MPCLKANGFSKSTRAMSGCFDMVLNQLVFFQNGTIIAIFLPDDLDNFVKKLI